MTGPAAEVLANLRGKLEGFQEHLPLIKALRNPGLRDRHWDKISQSQLLATAHELHLPMAAQNCCATEICILLVLVFFLSIPDFLPRYRCWAWLHYSSLVGMKHEIHTND